MKKKNIIVVSLIVAVLVGSFFAFRLVINRKRDQTGEDKFVKAMAELRSTEPQFDNPCLGGSVLRAYSYSQLSNKSVSDIKELAKKDPGSC